MERRASEKLLANEKYFILVYCRIEGSDYKQIESMGRNKRR